MVKVIDNLVSPQFLSVWTRADGTIGFYSGNQWVF